MGGPRFVVAESTNGRSRSGAAVNGRDKARPSKMEGHALSWPLEACVSRTASQTGPVAARSVNS